MSEVVVVVVAQAKPGQGDAALAAFGEVSVPTHAEEGCIRYALHRSAADPDQIVLVERWASREALDEHLATTHLQEFRASSGDLWAGPMQIIVTTPQPAGDPAKGTLG
ncbi:MAG: putative quinol monooxygenase [Thermoleophilia bacterium]